MRKCSRAAAISKHREDGDEPTVPDDAKWRTLAPYGLCTSMILMILIILLPKDY